MAGLEGIDASSMEIVDALGAVRYVYDFGDHIARPLVRHADRIPVAVHRPGPGSAAPERVVDRVRFGMPGFKGRLITNARDDKLETAATWKALFGKPGHHCLTAISYVLERDPTTMESYRIQRRDGRLMVVPGLCAVRHLRFASTGNEYDDLCHVQVTARADRFVATVHDRFVVDLADTDGRDAWMEAEVGACRTLLRPAPEDAYEMVPVSSDVWTRRGDEGAADPTGQARTWDDVVADAAGDARSRAEPAQARLDRV